MTLSADALHQMVEQNHTKAEEGHYRLRQDLREIETHVRVIEKDQVEHAKQLAELEAWRKQPLEATNIRFTPQMFFAGLALCATIVGGQKWSTNGIQDSLATQAAKIEVLSAKMDAVKQHNDDLMKLEDERSSTVARDMLQLRGQATMIDTKLNNLMMNRK